MPYAIIESSAQEVTRYLNDYETEYNYMEIINYAPTEEYHNCLIFISNDINVTYLGTNLDDDED